MRHVVLRQVHGVRESAAIRHAMRMLHAAPTAAKFLALLLLLLNAGSWPFVWHLRVLRCVVQMQLSFRLLRLRHIFAGKERRRLASRDWYEARLPIGVHPFHKTWKYSWRVGFHDSDFLLHMSNSSYAQVLDRVRMQLALTTFPTFLRCGGFAPLAAMHYHFIREIPMLSRYEVRASVGSWDEKWLYIVFRFVLPNSARGASLDAPSPSTPAAQQTGEALGNAEPDAVAEALLACAAKEQEPDGAEVYAVVVNRFCYKLGRITVPPAVVLAANGFYAAPDTTRTAGSPPYPPHWPAVRALNASIPAFRKFFTGGWRDVPAGERWWEDAFAACEAERRERLAPFVGEQDVGDDRSGGKVSNAGLVGGMERVRRLVF
ncbi:hypothetical protein GGX14DRAFT_475318 [Mycena pura]|uniref:Uncharacterized protein n=1 Tax=Mycena pura TaxID=153505 RepID=A0AAD6UWA6_9AGAR|nr:hypothetical protein GGX14DRAFT_475318 [Mycena pura]